MYMRMYCHVGALNNSAQIRFCFKILRTQTTQPGLLRNVKFFVALEVNRISKHSTTYLAFMLEFIIIRIIVTVWTLILFLTNMQYIGVSNSTT